MRRITTFALVMLLLSLGACKIVKRSDSRTAIERNQEAWITSSRLNYEIEWFGDGLKGKIPMPILSATPVTIPIESDGISLELTLTDSHLSYQASSKAVGRERITSDLLDQQSNHWESEQNSNQEVHRRSSLPWWMYLVIGTVLIIGLGYLATKVKYNY